MKIIYPFTHSFLDYPSVDGSCLSVYIIGCEHNCYGCSSPTLQNFNHMYTENTIRVGEETLSEKILKDIYYLPTKQVSFMGGDPCHPYNINELQKTINVLKKENIQIMVYTGYKIKHIKENNLIGFDFIKCGKYNGDLKKQSEKTDDYIQFASTNQKLYDKDLNLLSSKGRYYFVQKKI